MEKAGQGAGFVVVCNTSIRTVSTREKMRSAVRSGSARGCRHDGLCFSALDAHIAFVALIIPAIWKRYRQSRSW